jgi:hypothetical protein
VEATFKSAEVETYGLVHGDLFNVPLILLPRVQLQFKFTASKGDFYVMSSKTDGGAVLKFLDVALHVRQVKPSPTIQLEHAKLLEKVNARNDMTSVALKTFTLGAGSKSVSIENDVLGTLPNGMFFTMFRIADFTGSADINPYLFRHFGLNLFVVYVNWRQVHVEVFSLNTASAKNCTIAYQTLFSGLGIDHGNTGIQITPTQYMNRSFILVFSHA